MSSVSVSPAPILDLAGGFMATKHLFVANEIGLFEALGSTGGRLDEVAQVANVPPRTVRIIADAMVALGLVERAGDTYRNGPAAETFLSGQGPADLRPLLRFWNHISYPAWLDLEQAVRTGVAVPQDWTARQTEIFAAGVESLTAPAAHALAARYPFAAGQRVLDAGGGTGSFLSAIIAEYPGVRGTLFEQPAVAEVAAKRLAAAGLTGSINVVAGDLFGDTIPAGHDVILLANVVHYFTPERNVELLGRLRERVTSGARLLLIDFWTDATHTQPTMATLIAAEFLVLVGGDVYSEEEARQWLGTAGWRVLERQPLDGPLSLLIAEAA
jgi:predicted nicotinamide N-methyase